MISQKKRSYRPLFLFIQLKHLKHEYKATICVFVTLYKITITFR